MITVIIPVYNRGFCIEDCLEGLVRQTFPQEGLEILLVDDGSTDDTVGRASRFQDRLPGLRIIQQPNQGPAAARNNGIGQARGDIIAFLDSDCVPDPDWLEKLLAPFETNPQLLGVEGQTLPASDTWTPLDHFVENRMGGQYWTCNIAYRTDALKRVGGFDQGFTQASGEDIDLAHRIRQSAGGGEAIRFEPAAIVRHLILKRSLKAQLRTARTFSSMIRLWRKHPGLLVQGNTTFKDIVIFQFRHLIFPMWHLRGQLLKNPGVYILYCVLQVGMMIDTLLRLPVYRREATAPLVVVEPLRVEEPAG